MPFPPCSPLCHPRLLSSLRRTLQLRAWIISPYAQFAPVSMLFRTPSGREHRTLPLATMLQVDDFIILAKLGDVSLHDSTLSSTEQCGLAYFFRYCKSGTFQVSTVVKAHVAKNSWVVGQPRRLYPSAFADLHHLTEALMVCAILHLEQEDTATTCLVTQAV